MMKKLLLLCTLLLGSLLAGCGVAPVTSSSAPSSAPVSSSSEPEGPYYPKAKSDYNVVPIPTAEPEPQPEAPAETPAPQPTPEPAPAQSSYVGIFYDTTDQYAPEYTPSITFGADGSFNFYVNLLEGMGDIFGTYSESGGVISCTVTSRDFMGFAGDTMGSFSFTAVDGNTLVYNGEMVGGTQPGTSFVRY